MTTKTITGRAKLELMNCDCLEFMSTLPDNAFDLAIVDPPYGIGEDWKKRTGNRKRQFKETSYKNKREDKAYFEGVIRVSKSYIIWGWNYYTEYLGSTNYLIVWDKKSANNDVFHYSKCEIAATNIKIPCNIISLQWEGYRMGNETGTLKIHPHQKPIALYKWLLTNYAKPGDTIFDSHGGSMSLAIACWDLKFDCTICELDKDYYKAAVARFNRHKSQGQLF